MTLEGISPDQLQMTDTPRLIWIPVREAVKLRWERNPKQHDLGLLAASFRKHGFKTVPHYDSFIGVDDGNGRVECLDWMERQHQPIIRGIATTSDGTWVMPLIVGVDDKSKALAESYAIDANNLVLSGAEFAPWEIAKLWDEQSYLSILQELAGGDALPVSVDSEALSSLLQEPPTPEPQDAGELIYKAAELQAKWQVQRGDVWTVGKHRVMCGDSTNVADVARLMQSERGFCFSDPPYNVGKDYGEQTNDSKSRDEYRQWSALWFAEAKQVCDAIVFTPGAVNVWMWADIQKPKWLVIWVKRNQQSRNGAGGWNAYEPILCYGKVKIDYDVFDELMDASDSIAHPVPKTLKAWVKILDDLSKDALVIYDPFLGSGTTLVACEQTERIGRGMEIEPKYVSVSLERLSLLGLTPQRAD